MRRQLRSTRKPSNKVVDNRSIDNEVIDDEHINDEATEGQARNEPTDDVEITERRANRRGTKPTVRRPISGTLGGQPDGRALLRAMEKQMELQTKIMRKVLEESQSQSTRIEELQNEVEKLRKALHATTNETQSLRASIETVTTTIAGQDRSGPSYADIARMPQAGQLSNTRQATMTTPPTPIDMVFCTIDTSRMEDEQGEQLTPGAIRTLTEGEVRVDQSQSKWRCLAVTKDPKKPRIRIACRNEQEHAMVKQLVEAKLPRGARMLRDELYPVKVDYVSRMVVLDEANTIRSGAAEEIGKENDVQVAKVGWLSNRDVPKAYGSMVMYLTKRADAERLLAEGYAYAGGQSGRTKVFESRPRLDQCYNCQQMGRGHKAHQCDRPQVCGKCAKEGHHHSACTETILKCVPCGGPHASFSRNCKKLYPSLNE